MSNAYQGLAQGIGEAVGCLWALLKLAAIAMLIAGAVVGGFQIYKWSRVDKSMTIERGLSLCASHGYNSGVVDVGDGIKRNDTGYARSSVECFGGQADIRIFFEFDTNKSP